MPLFECTKCGAVENTALCNFWLTRPAICSECDPEIGQWHGRFPKKSVAVYLAGGKDRWIDYPAKEAPDDEAQGD